MPKNSTTMDDPVPYVPTFSAPSLTINDPALKEKIDHKVLVADYRRSARALQNQIQAMLDDGYEPGVNQQVGSLNVMYFLRRRS